ncbi:hypothetical protein K435DRAFT_745644 [Dendrothele bispora CBS 962.96]|uniref:NudC domain-containing protein 1 n=1 Tax=Dendrothele bispora (strain CBS 962.96) TaxID=1314807 RepID=A0A4S8MQH5_DENBC|nr:hypothetical protein K435DRAFT_745644 [Dendrothele bispora CBS 962.96]
MDAFVVNRKLINSKFEGYKLDPVDQNQIISRFPLEHGASQATVPSRTLLSFQEVQSRISHNHLSVSPSETYAVYVDEDYRVVQIDVASDTLAPSTRVVFELPKPVLSSSVDLHPEYPSAAFSSQDLLFLSDGYGLMYLLRPIPTGPYSLISTYQLDKSRPDRPFRLHSINSVGASINVAILSSRNSESHLEHNHASTVKASQRKPSHVEFDIYGVQFDSSPSRASAENHVCEMNIVWNLRGQDVPIYTGYNSSSQAFFLIGGSSYRSLHSSPPAPAYDPTPDEIAPIPRPDENLDVAKPPPYSWTQTSDSVTVAFPLPSSTPKSRINIEFTSEALTLHVEASEEQSSVIPIPSYKSKALWDRISPSSSYWTWDKEAEHSFGCLTLHLDKQHERTKWMQVFAYAGTKPSSESSPEDVEVPETLDPSELWQIRESLEKYTAALMTGEDASGLGLGRGVPGLAEGEMDEEVDSSVGRSACISWVGQDGSSPSWFKPGREQPLQLLSSPFPGMPFPNLSLIVKEGLDGVVYTLESDTVMKWTHTKTFSALAFVLASKQDVRFTYHTSDLVFAFENGLRDRGGNVYVYRSTPVNEKWAKQAILKMGDGAGGSLLGVGMIAVQGQRIVLALAEKELITLKLW